MRIYLTLLCLITFGFVQHSVVRSEEKIASKSKEQIHFFETEVRPVLAMHCYKCHGEEKQNGELRIDSLEALLKGGESGPAIVQGKPEESLLIEAINHESFEMPEQKLDDKTIGILTRWVRMGAVWPASNSKQFDWAAKPQKKFTEKDRSFWVFQPVKTPHVPAVADPRWSKSSIDQFIKHKLKQAGLTPAPQADRLVLIRRASFDLIGLPPTPTEVDQFLSDKDSDDVAFAKVVDRLLESKHYGERWGRHWLDLVRYAESDGFNQDAYRPTAWRYRDYVVDSFNADKPYDQFVMEQIAGDEIAPDDPQAQVATGYLRHYIYEYNQRDARTQWDDILNNVTDATGEVFLGFGMGCARCHDHKFDPITQEDYFRLKAFFAPMMPRDNVVIATAKQKAEYDQKLNIWEDKTTEIRQQIDELTVDSLDDIAAKQIKMFPPDIQEVMHKEESVRTADEAQLAYLVNRQVIDEKAKIIASLKKGKTEKSKQYQELLKQLAEFDSLKPAALPTAPGVSDYSSQAPVTSIQTGVKAKDILPGFLSILEPTPVSLTATSSKQSTGRRTALARWITNPDNRVSTRVITNRIWQYHFGEGLVSTSNDFGHLGELPSHPELLDWLTNEFVQQGWSFKKMHRLIMNSATYKLSATHQTPEQCMQIDPSNRLHWRRDIRRLNAEQIRDSTLAVSGGLLPEIGGASVKGTVNRRSIYVISKRNVKDPVLGAFDFAGGITSTSKRNVTTTPTQSLLMINGSWLLSQAGTMAKRIESTEKSDVKQITLAYRLVYGRSPSEQEQQRVLSFLDRQTIDPKETSGHAALTDLCHVLLNSSEFLYVD